MQILSFDASESMEYGYSGFTVQSCSEEILKSKRWDVDALEETAFHKKKVIDNSRETKQKTIRFLIYCKNMRFKEAKREENR